MEIDQYNIILVNLDPTVGHEIKKTRPCVVISPNEMNKYLRTLVIAPMITGARQYPTHVPVFHDNKKGQVALDQVRTIDKQRVVKVLDVLTRTEILKIKAVMKETY
ncbi:MAG: type II toxin-antitoxin system PemK/MazF family toxin, partial [Cyclobacteriaceae bacterium]|nr:type II toxin-antitoxin system PemK/MazF family toxin [Cyclobacteriaceae bacterium]